MTKLLVATVGLLLTSFGAVFFGVGGNQTYSVTGHFVSAEGVTPGNDVVVSGVVVGKVTQVAVAPESDRSGGALITMQVDHKYAPFRQGTHLQIRPKGFLGNMFIDVAPGADGNTPIRSGGSIPIENTAAPVDLSQVMDIFDPNTRAKIKTATLEGGKMLQGRGQDVNKVLSELPAISAQTADVTANLDSEQQVLDQLTVEFDIITQQMAAEDQSFRADIAQGADLLQALAAHEAAIQAEIVYANEALGRINAGLGGHEQDLSQLLKEMPALQARLRELSSTSDPVLADVNMCYSNIIDAIAGLRSSTGYKYPHNSQDGAGYELRVYTTINLPGQATTGSLHPAQLSCAGGTPTP